MDVIVTGIIIAGLEWAKRLGRSISLSKLKTVPVCLYVLVMLLSLLGGCQTPVETDPLLEQITQLEEQNQQLADQIAEIQNQNQQLEKQVQVLANIPEQEKGENLYNVERIKIGRLTGLFDKDEDDTLDTLIVYIQPIDTQGDIIKASGSIDVQLWDLNNADGQAKLGQWQVGPEQLKDLWIAFVATNYRLPFDIKDIIEDFDRSLTVKVTFTDHLSGKIFEGQKVIEAPSGY